MDAEKLRRDIAAQGVITEELGRQASRTVQAYAEQKRAELRARYRAATDPQQKQAVRVEVDEPQLEPRVLHVLIGVVTGVGGAALSQEALAAAAEEMRRITLESSARFKEVRNKETMLSNTSGISVGSRCDLEPTKAGGTRVDLD